MVVSSTGPSKKFPRPPPLSIIEPVNTGVVLTNIDVTVAPFWNVLVATSCPFAYKRRSWVTGSKVAGTCVYVPAGITELSDSFVRAPPGIVVPSTETKNCNRPPGWTCIP